MSLPIRFERSLNNMRTLPYSAELEVSLSMLDGTPLKFSANGKLTPITAASDRPIYILNGAAQTSATGSLVNLAQTPAPITNQIGNGYDAQSGPFGNQTVKALGGYGEVLPVLNGNGIWRQSFAPVIQNQVGAVTGSPTTITVTSPNAFVAGAFVGGTLFCASLNQQAQIIASTACAAGAAITLTLASPLGNNGATINADGLTFSATPLGKGMSGYKFGTASGTVAGDGYVPSQLGVGSADASGGFLQIFEVDMLNKQIGVIYN